MLEDEKLLNLVPKAKRPILELYLRYWQMGWRSFTTTNKDTTTKQEQIRLLEKAIRRDFPLKQNLLAQLQRAFVAEDVSLSLLLDLLSVWRYLATDRQPTSEEQLSEIIGATVSPPARLIMVLNNEQPSTYLPAQALLSAVLWRDLWIKKSTLVQKIKLSTRQKNSKLSGQLKSATVLLTIVQSKRLKWRLALFLNRMAILWQNNKQERIGVLDEIKIILYSIYQFFMVRHRTVTRRGI